MKTYTWLGPNRFVPPFGYMETDKKTPPIPFHTAKFFESKGWLKIDEEKKAKDKPLSKKVTLSEDIKVGDK